MNTRKRQETGNDGDEDGDRDDRGTGGHGHRMMTGGGRWRYK